MVNDLSRVIDIMKKFDISITQFIIPYLIYLDNIEDRGEGKELPSLAAKYFYICIDSDVIPTVKRSDIDKLVDLDLLINRSKDGKIYLKKLDYTERFEKLVGVTDDRFEEFWNLYPTLVNNFSNPRGPKIPLRTGSKTKLRKQYKRLIKTKKLHNRVVAAMAWALETDNFQNMAIDKFLDSEHYTVLIQEMDRWKGSAGSVSPNIVR